MDDVVVVGSESRLKTTLSLFWGEKGLCLLIFLHVALFLLLAWLLNSLYPPVVNDNRLFIYFRMNRSNRSRNAIF